MWRVERSSVVESAFDKYESEANRLHVATAQNDKIRVTKSDNFAAIPPLSSEKTTSIIIEANVACSVLSGKRRNFHRNDS